MVRNELTRWCRREEDDIAKSSDNDDDDDDAVGTFGTVSRTVDVELLDFIFPDGFVIIFEESSAVVLDENSGCN